MNCSLHLDQEITWVCLERNCEQRVMCSRCAVKVHLKSHKLEELQTVIQSGIMNSYLNNPDNNTYGVHRLSTQIESKITQDQKFDVEKIVNNVAENLTQVMTAIQRMSSQLIEATQNTYIEEEAQRINVNNNIKALEARLSDGQYSNSQELTSIINQAFSSISDYAQEKEGELQDQHNSDLALYQKKLTILSNMQQSFGSMISLYLENQFTQDFQQLFQMQLLTLSFDKNENIQMEQESDLQSLYNEQTGGDVSDSNGFLDFIQRKWKQDYENIELTLNRFTAKLSEGLKYVINMPIKVDEQSPFKSPVKQQNIQQYSSFQTPVYYRHPQTVNMPQQQYFPGQQFFVSPQPPRDENFAHKFKDNHMTYSQIVYTQEEPQQQAAQNKKIEVQPVCQRVLQQRDNEVTVKPIKAKGDALVEGNPSQKVTQTLSTFINKIINVTNKSINK